jgi:DNA-binding NarL/FixJ family response regulator
VFADDSPYQQPQTVRALYTLLRAVEQKPAGKTRSDKPPPRKAGASRTPEEDQQLTEAFKRGEPVAQIAQLHERSPRAIEARLVRLGLVEERWQAR